MATVEEMFVEVHTEAALTCAQLNTMIQGIEHMMENDPEMPKQERAELSHMVELYTATAHKMGCPGY